MGTVRMETDRKERGRKEPKLERAAGSGLCPSQRAQQEILMREKSGQYCLYKDNHIGH
jgi:hypothetical protein